MKKLVKWIVLLAVIFVTSTIASELMFFDSFSTNPFKTGRWDSWGAQAYWDNSGFVVMNCVYPSSEVVIRNHNLIYAEAGMRYKVSFWFKHIRGDSCFKWVRWGGWIKENTTWEKFVFFVITESYESDKIEFTVYGGPLYIDNVEIKKCSVGVEPTSLGKVKALYN